MFLYHNHEIYFAIFYIQVGCGKAKYPVGNSRAKYVKVIVVSSIILLITKALLTHWLPRVTNLVYHTFEIPTYDVY